MTTKNNKILQKITTVIVLASSISIFVNFIIVDKVFAKDQKCLGCSSAYYDNGYLLNDGKNTMPIIWL